MSSVSFFPKTADWRSSILFWRGAIYILESAIYVLEGVNCLGGAL